MPHKCVRCGKEYRTNECEILKGCRECGGRKFVFIPQLESDPKTGEPPLIASPAPEEVSENETEADTTPDILRLEGDRLESIRIVSPGTYELNIEKLADSDEGVVGIGRGEGSYLVDLLSMVRPKRKKPKK
jgi:predicted  nucleic acid-binding Zn-ribbon protein